MNGQVEKSIRDLPKLRQFIDKLTSIFVCESYLEEERGV